MANIKGKQLSSNLAVTNVTASGHISGSNTSTGSFAHVVVTSKVSGSSVSTGSFGRVEIGAGGIDTAGDITLDGDGGDIILKDGGVEYGRFTQLLGGLTIKSGPAGIAALVIASASASPTIIVGGEIQTSKNITGSSVTTGSFGNVNALRSITAADISASVIQASQGTIDIHSLSGYVANENIDHSSVTITAGSGLTGGGDITSTRTLAVGAGTGVTVNANDVAIGQAVSTTSNVQFANITGSIISGSSLLGVVGTATQGTIDHDGLANFVANEHINHTSVSITAGDGLTGGGTIASTRDIAVGAGSGITVNANDVAVTAAQTAITSLINSSLTKIGTATDQEYIKFDTSNEVNVHINNSEKLSVTTAGANVTGDFAASATASAAHILVTGIISGSQLEASGDVIAFSSSDRRFKDNLVVIEGSLDKIGKINGYEFDWNNKQTAYKGHDIGVVAQEIEAVLPEVVTTRGDGYKAVKYEKIVPLLIESIKELQKKVEDIEKNCDCLNK